MSDVSTSNLFTSLNDSKSLLPNHDNVVIPIEKFSKYALNPEKQPHKALAFELALGYNLGNILDLIYQIHQGLSIFPAKFVGNRGYGDIYEVLMHLTGVNMKTAKVMTIWLDDCDTKEIRLITVYVDK